MLIDALLFCIITTGLLLVFAFEDVNKRFFNPKKYKICCNLCSRKLKLKEMALVDNNRCELCKGTNDRKRNRI